jgi:hypothetical protein
MNKSQILSELNSIKLQIQNLVARIENNNLVAEKPISDVLEALDYLEQDLDHAIIDLHKSDKDITD